MSTCAQGVLISGGDGLGNITAPTDDPGFANVGIRGSGSAVYLGHGWVLTDYHVGAGSTIFNKVTYSAVAGSGVQLTNPPGAGYTAYSDLLLFRITELPNIPPVEITSTAPALNWQVVMAGNGRDRNASEAYWTSSWAPATSPSPYAGYIWASTNNMRWGTNVVAGISIPQGVGQFSETTFSTQFDSTAPAGEAQGTPGDSGGGVFHKDTSNHQWYLAGIMASTSALTGQPWGLSAYGNVTFTADLSVYRSQIYQTLALPGDVNFDGTVNGSDIVIVAANWLKTGTVAGDANHDGIVNGADLATIASNWTMPGSAGAGQAAAIPEPATFGLAFCGLVLLLATRLGKGGRRP